MGPQEPSRFLLGDNLILYLQDIKLRSVQTLQLLSQTILLLSSLEHVCVCRLREEWALRQNWYPESHFTCAFNEAYWTVDCKSDVHMQHASAEFAFASGQLAAGPVVDAGLLAPFPESAPWLAEAALSTHWLLVKCR